MKNDRNQDRGWGGARPGSGRKPSPQKAALRQLLAAGLDPEQWTDLFHQLRDDAMNGNLHAIKLLLHYRFGVPGPKPPSPAPRGRSRNAHR